MHTASSSDWAAAVSAAVAVCSATAIPFLLWVDADYLLVKDWQALGDRVLVEVTNARHALLDARRTAAVTAAALALILSAPAPEALR